MIRPLGVLDGANVEPPSTLVGADRVTAATAPHPPRRFDVFPDMTPPRPQDVWDDADMERWYAAHADQHTTHRCNLGPNHDGACRCHCGRTFEFGQEGL